MRDLTKQELGLVAGGLPPVGSTHITVVLKGGNGGSANGGIGGEMLNAGTGGNGIGAAGGDGTVTFNGGQSTYNFEGGNGGTGGAGAPAVTLSLGLSTA